MMAYCLTCERDEPVRFGDSARKDTCPVHFIDVRRAIGHDWRKNRQYPVICERDFVTVVANSYRRGATTDKSKVTCKSCIKRLNGG